jgi:hypothetical protein
VSDAQKSLEFAALAEKELQLAAQVTEQKGSPYYFQRAHVLAQLARTVSDAQRSLEFEAEAERELQMAAQVTEQKGSGYYFQRAQVLAQLALAAKSRSSS